MLIDIPDQKRLMPEQVTMKRERCMLLHRMDHRESKNRFEKEKQRIKKRTIFSV